MLRTYQKVSTRAVALSFKIHQQLHRFNIFGCHHFGATVLHQAVLGFDVFVPV